MGKLQIRMGIIVLGMHRSGTSALTRVLSLLGCDLPKTLMGGNDSNEAGYWESAVICNLNDRILKSAGSTWHDWLEFDPDWVDAPDAAAFRQEALAALEDEFGASRLFVLKDPRICRFTQFWADILIKAGVRPVVAFSLRNPLEVASSLEKRDDVDPLFSHLLWLRYVLDAEFASRGMPRLFTSYDRLMSDWGAIADQAPPLFGFSWPQPSDQAAAEIETFLSDRFRHHSEPPERVFESPALSNWLRDTFRILDGWVETGESIEDFAALDRIRTEFNASAPAFAPPVAWVQAAAEKGHLEKNLAEAQVRLGQAEVALAQRDSQVERGTADLAAARDELRQMGERARKAAEARAALEAEQEATAAKLDAQVQKTARLVLEMAKRAREAEAATDKFGRAVAALLEARSWPLLPAGLRLKRQVDLLKRSGLFDAEWYLVRYKDVAEAGVDPVKHYIEHGLKEGRAPNVAIAKLLRPLTSDGRMRSLDE